MITSISKIRLFKSCRRAYELKYVYGVVPVKDAEALEIGKTYHSKIEELYNSGDIDTSDLSKESAMAEAYKKYVYPKFKVKSVEQWFAMPLGEHTIRGRVDGIADDKSLVEHKTTSASSMEEYEYNLQWDEQILCYMLAENTQSMYYTVIKKPTIRKKKSETDEDFFNRMVEWYDTDTDDKIRVMNVWRSAEELTDFRNELAEICTEMDEAEAKGRMYRNQSYCNHWGRRCEYAPICKHYDLNLTYVDFERRSKSENREAECVSEW